MKYAAHDVAEIATQDMAEDVLGVKVLKMCVTKASFAARTTTTTTTTTFSSKYLNPWPASPTQHFRGQKDVLRRAATQKRARPRTSPVRGQVGLRTHAQHTRSAPTPALWLHVRTST